MSEEKDVKSNNKFIIIGVVVLLLAGGAFYFMSGKEEAVEENIAIVEKPQIEESRTDTSIEPPKPEVKEESIFIPEPEVVTETEKTIIEPPSTKKPTIAIKPAPSAEEQAIIEAQEKKSEQKKFVESLRNTPSQVHGKQNGVIVDQIITPSFVENVSFFLVENYTPPPHGQRTGTVHLNPEMVNTHYGVDLTGLPGAGNAYYVREILLDFVYQPSNFNTLYLLYSDKIIEDMLRASTYPHNDRPGFSVNQQEAMYYDYARYFFSAGHSVQTILNMPNLEQIFATKAYLDNNLKQNRARFASVQHAYDEANLEGNKAVADGLKEEMFVLAELIGADQAALSELENQVVFAHSNTDKQIFPATDLIYIFDWLGRRYAQDSENFMAASRDLEDVAFKLSADFVTKAKLIQ